MSKKRLKRIFSELNRPVLVNDGTLRKQDTEHWLTENIVFRIIATHEAGLSIMQCMCGECEKPFVICAEIAQMAGILTDPRAFATFPEAIKRANAILRSCQ